MNDHRKAIRRLSSEIDVGDKNSFSFFVSDEIVTKFAALSGDWNPLHTNKEYARKVGCKAKVAHGAYQQALVSQAVGMWIIGEKCLISALSTKFFNPLYCGSDVKVESEITEWSKKYSIGKVLVKVIDANNSQLYSESLVKVTLHSNVIAEEIPSAAIDKKPDVTNKKQSDRKLVVIAGATSGIFQHILASIANEYDLLLLGRNKDHLENIAERLPNPDRHSIASIDFIKDSGDYQKVLMPVVKNRVIWGMVYAAANRPNNSRIIDWNLSSFHQEMIMSGYAGIELAKFLSEYSSDAGGRMVLLGSNYSIHHHPQRELLQYGVGKSLLTHIGQGLALELAKHKISVNVISPDFVAYGMNAETPERLIKMKMAANPMKKLCTPSDIAQLLLYLLDSPASYVSGQDIVLSGGIL